MYIHHIREKQDAGPLVKLAASLNGWCSNVILLLYTFEWQKVRWDEQWNNYLQTTTSSTKEYFIFWMVSQLNQWHESFALLSCSLSSLAWGVHKILRAQCLPSQPCSSKGSTARFLYASLNSGPSMSKSWLSRITP